MPNVTAGRGQKLCITVLATLIIAFLAHINGAQAARLVVLDSTDLDRFALGSIVDSEQRLEIDEGTSVTLMDEAGRTATVVGPYSGIPGGSAAADGEDLIGPIAALLSKLVRGDRGLPPSDPWLLDVTKAEDRCVQSGVVPLFWRRDAEGNDRLTLKPRGGDRVSLDWPSGQATLPWPASVPMTDGTGYAVQIQSNNRPSRFTVHVADAADMSPMVASWMAAAGCQSQANVMLVALEVDKIIQGWEADDSGLF